jgi:hypothetical protein
MTLASRNQQESYQSSNTYTLKENQIHLLRKCICNTQYITFLLRKVGLLIRSLRSLVGSCHTHSLRSLLWRWGRPRESVRGCPAFAPEWPWRGVCVAVCVFAYVVESASIKRILSVCFCCSKQTALAGAVGRRSAVRAGAVGLVGWAWRSAFGECVI